MTRLLVCTFAGFTFALAILAGGFDHAATAKPISTAERAKACKACYDRCGKFNPICRTHCQSRSGCPAPTSAPKSAQ
jgi:hypothetical protein